MASQIGTAVLVRPAWVERVLRWLSSLPGGGRQGRACTTLTVDATTRDEPPPTITDLYHARRLAMVRLAVLLVDDLHTAEDVVQDAFAALYRRHGSTLTDITNATAYLHTAVVNAARSVLRRRDTVRRHVPLSQPPAPDVDERLMLAEEHRLVIRGLHRLPTRQREVVVLRYWLNLSEAEIAETLSISRGTVKSTASRALTALERLVKEHG